MKRRFVAPEEAAESAEQRHARVAKRLDHLRETLARPLCLPSFLAGASWVVLLATQASPPYLVALVPTVLSPLCLGVAVVLTAVSSQHTPFAAVRRTWIVIAAAACCTAFALAALARHMPPAQ